MDWLADDSTARPAHAAAEPLVQKLAVLVFQGDSDWPNHVERVDAYRDALAEWFVGDTAGLSQFDGATGADADPGACFDWFVSVVREWEQRAGNHATGTASHGSTPTGLSNPNCDGTPGTEFYRLDEATGQYLFATLSDSPDWATYEQRRYSEPARDDDYGLDYRLDRTQQVYEWYDEAADTWRDQTWADLHAAKRHDPTAAARTPGADNGAPVEWDGNWAMFYRIGPGAVYEFADAVTPGDKSSGCTDRWLSHEQVLQRQAGAAPEPASAAAQPETPREFIRAYIPDIAKLIPDFDEYTDEEVSQAVEGLLGMMEGR
jgi:hypothetical protein